MKLLVIEMSRLTYLFNATRSGGQLYLPTALAAMAERYQFVGFPRDMENLNRDHIEFKHGKFNDTAIESLDIYNDGIVVGSRCHTDVLDAFVADTLSWMETEWQTSIFKTHNVSKLYESSMLVEAEKDILRPLEGFSRLTNLLEDGLFESSALTVKFEPIGVSIGSDQTKNPALKPASFRLERRIGIAYELNQFTTTAPLKTGQHLNLVNQLEELF